MGLETESKSRDSITGDEHKMTGTENIALVISGVLM